MFGREISLWNRWRWKQRQSFQVPKIKLQMQMAGASNCGTNKFMAKSFKGFYLSILCSYHLGSLRSAPGSSNGIQERVKLLLYCGRKILQRNKNHLWISSCWLKEMLHQFGCHMIRRDRRMCLGNAFRCSHSGRFLVNSKTHHNRCVFYWVKFTDLGLTSPQKIVRKWGYFLTLTARP